MASRIRRPGNGKLLVIFFTETNHDPVNFPKYWAKGECGYLQAWRGSSNSLAEAQALANQAAQRLAERFRVGNFPPQRGGYYPDRPFREPVLHEIKDAADEVSAVVTRNSYGCQVLNTARIMFVDVDLPEPKPAGGFLKRLFGSPTPAPKASADNALAKVEMWTRQRPDWGWRIYRTRAGLRLLATHGLIAPESSEADGVFEALDADPLYRRLCQTQKCYRARLTPKPWRCGVTMKPERWPFADEKREKRFQRWLTNYENSAAHWAACQFIRRLGNPTVHPEVQSIIKLHDAATRAEADLKLA
ncbi:MAG TPA: hypothetical protein PLT00_08740 [Verrucomicrobiota bacterium]|nr:hypothetical protein [Verrucomicrobiota bacterium]HQB16782.1 hypothetical protein [Verrucomicrobiota bacterium]